MKKEKEYFKGSKKTDEYTKLSKSVNQHNPPKYR